MLSPETRSALMGLAERVEALPEANFDDLEVRKLNEAVLLAIGWRQDGRDIIDPTGRVQLAAPPVLASLDAAMTLVPEGHCWRFDCFPRAERRYHALIEGGPDIWAATPALAVTAACLRAIAGEAEL